MRFILLLSKNEDAQGFLKYYMGIA